MPDSNITKRALASALKELMEDSPFSKISTTGQPVECDGDSFPLQEGEWVYTVYATWNSSEDWGGYAWYYVGITG